MNIVKQQTPHRLPDDPHACDQQEASFKEISHYLDKQSSILAATPSIWPVMGHITDSFGERLDPFNGEGAFHTGVDVASDYGAPVHSTADGIVTISENHAGYGRLVVIDHGFGITTWYAHLSSFSAVPGARVKRGEVVGYTGISGRSTGPHVHYEVRMNNAPINPWRYMRATPAGD